MAQRRGYSVEAAMAGLTLAKVDPAENGARIDWDEFATFINRLFEGASVAEMEAAGEDYVQVNAWMQLSLPFFVTPRLLYYGTTQMTSTLKLFPHMHCPCEAHDTHLHFEFHLPEPYVACPAFFHGLVGEYRKINTLLHRPPARVEAVVGPRDGVYDVFYDEPPSPLDQVLASGRNVFEGVAGELRRLLQVATDTEPPAADIAPTAVLELQRRYGLTLAEARVTARLGKGLRVPDIARELGISPGTVRCHLKAAYAKTGARSQAMLVRIALGMQASGREG